MKKLTEAQKASTKSRILATLRESALLDLSDTAEFRAAKEEWEGFEETREGQLVLIEAAKERDMGAVKYIFMLLLPQIRKAFWSYYLGPNAGARRSRLEQGAESEFLSEVFIRLLDTPSPLDSFNPDKYEGDTDLINKLGFYVQNYLKSMAIRANSKESRKGITGKIGGEDEPSYSAYEDNEHGQEVYNAEDRALNSELFSQWVEMSTDPILDALQYPSSRDILKAILEQETFSINKLIAALAVPGRNFGQFWMRKRLAKVKDILESYEIDREAFMTLLTYPGPVVLADEL